MNSHISRGTSYFWLMVSVPPPAVTCCHRRSTMLEGETLLVILAALQASSAPALEVYQTPRVSAGERSSVTLFCNFTFKEESPGFYKWYRHHVGGAEVTNTSDDFSGRVSIVSPEDFMYHKSANIHLHQLHESDIGLYICAVTLMTDPEQTAYGNGTALEVTRFVADDRKSRLAVTISVIVAIVIVISLSVTIVLGYHRKLSGCLLLRMMGDAEDPTYCIVEEVRSHVDGQPIPQQRNSSEDPIYIMDNWQYAPPIPTAPTSRY